MSATAADLPEEPTLSWDPVPVDTNDYTDLQSHLSEIICDLINGNDSPGLPAGVKVVGLDCPRQSGVTTALAHAASAVASARIAPVVFVGRNRVMVQRFLDLVMMYATRTDCEGVVNTIDAVRFQSRDVYLHESPDGLVTGVCADYSTRSVEAHVNSEQPRLVLVETDAVGPAVHVMLAAEMQRGSVVVFTHGPVVVRKPGSAPVCTLAPAAVKDFAVARAVDRPASPRAAGGAPASPASPL